jgi:hypothetical protein
MFNREINEFVFFYPSILTKVMAIRKKKEKD